MGGKKCGGRRIWAGWVAENAPKAAPEKFRVANNTAGVAFGEVVWPKMLRRPI